MDFAIKIKPDLTSKQLVRIGQVATLVLVVLACLWAPQIERYSSLWEYLQLVLSFIAPPVAAAFIVGLFDIRANGTGAFVSLMVGAGVSIAYLLADGYEVDNWFTEMHFLHRTFYLFVLCGLVNIMVSRLTPAPSAEQVANYTWSRSLIAEETAELEDVVWYKNYRYQAVVLLVITFILVGWFW
jgi:SSS family solute:Na+ symporter